MCVCVQPALICRARLVVRQNAHTLACIRARAQTYTSAQHAHILYTQCAARARACTMPKSPRRLVLTLPTLSRSSISLSTVFSLPTPSPLFLLLSICPSRCPLYRSSFLYHLLLPPARLFSPDLFFPTPSSGNMPARIVLVMSEGRGQE